MSVALIEPWRKPRIPVLAMRCVAPVGHIEMGQIVHGLPWPFRNGRLVPDGHGTFVVTYQVDGVTRVEEHSVRCFEPVPVRGRVSAQRAKWFPHLPPAVTGVDLLAALVSSRQVKRACDLPPVAA